LLETVQTDPSYKPNAESVMPLLNGTTGEILRALETPFALRLRRRSWLELISTGVDIRVCCPFSSPNLNV
jgi:hypothetical protein